MFCAAVVMQKHGTLDWLLLRSGILTPENEHKYRINLCAHDPETDSLSLRFPLFVTSAPEVNFTDFMKMLASRGIRYNGHPNHILNYSIVSKGDEAAFQKVYSSIPNIDITRLVDITTSYYASTPYAKKLCDFLEETAPMMYLTHESSKTGLV